MDRRLRIGACLSLSGKFARFGRQAALGLEVWRSLDGTRNWSSRTTAATGATLEAALPDVAAKCDLLLGPYSTILMRAAGRIAADAGRLIWNQGGSGDDVELAHPGPRRLGTDADEPVRGAVRALHRAGRRPRRDLVHRSRARQLRPPGGGRRARRIGAPSASARCILDADEASSRRPASPPIGTCSARECSSRTRSWPPRRCACPIRRGGCARSPPACGTSPGPSVTRTACSASRSGSPAAATRWCSVRPRMSSCAPTRQRRQRAGLPGSPGSGRSPHRRTLREAGRRHEPGRAVGHRSRPGNFDPVRRLQDRPSHGSSGESPDGPGALGRGRTGARGRG